MVAFGSGIGNFPTLEVDIAYVCLPEYSEQMNINMRSREIPGTHTQKERWRIKKISVNIWSTLRVHGMMDSWIKIRAVTFGLTKGRNLTGFIQFTTPTQS